MNLKASYTALSGATYAECDHSSALFAAEAAGEPEVQGFPYSERFEEGDGLRELESRMGFVDENGNVMTRDEAFDLYGSYYAEELIG